MDVISGASRGFCSEAVKPNLDMSLPEQNHPVALFGWGPETLGYDTPISRDHNWGRECCLF